MGNGGDQLARGAVRATFSTGNATEEKWKEAFGSSEAKLNVLSDEEREAMLKQAEAVVEQLKLTNTPQPTTKFRAVQDRIIVQRAEAETKVGTLFVADESKERPAEGIVVAIGPGRYVDGELQKPTISVGERVVFGKFSGAEVKIGYDEYLVLREEDIFLVKE